MNISLGNSISPSVPPMLGRNVDDSLSDRMQAILPTNEGSGLSKQADLSKINSLIGGSINNNNINGGFHDLKKLNSSGRLLPTQSMKKPSEPAKLVTDENSNKLESFNPSPATSGDETVEKVTVAKKRKPRKKWKKPKDKPNRPLSAYNLFFQQERALMLKDSNAPDSTKDEASEIPANNVGRRIHRKTHGKVGFAEMARSIGAKWKSLPDADKGPFILQASKEKQRYAKELAAWKELQLQKIKEQEMGIRLAANNDRRKSDSSNGFDGLSMSTDAITRQKLAFLQDTRRGSQDLSSLNILRALQGQQQQQPQQQPENKSMNSYPNAAEASANAIFQQFQGVLSQQQPPQPSELNSFRFSSTGGVPGGSDMSSSSSLSLAEQLQLNTVAQQRMQLERLQMQQLLLQNQLALSNVTAQAPVCNNTTFDTLQQQMNPNFNSWNLIGNNNRDFSQLGGFFTNQQQKL